MRQRIQTWLTQPISHIKQVVPQNWKQADSRESFYQKGMLASRLNEAITHAQHEGFERQKHTLPRLRGLGHQIDLEVLAGRVIGAQITFAPQSSSADWMLIAPLLMGQDIPMDLMPSELQKHAMGKWKLTDHRQVVYSMQTQAHPSQPQEAVLLHAHIRLLPTQ